MAVSFSCSALSLAVGGRSRSVRARWLSCVAVDSEVELLLLCGMERGLLVGGVARARRQPSASSDNAARFTPFRLPTKRGAARGRHVSAAAAQLQRGSLLGATERPAQRKRSPWRERPQRRERPPSAAVVGSVLRLCGSAARSSARALHELTAVCVTAEAFGTWENHFHSE